MLKSFGSASGGKDPSSISDFLSQKVIEMAIHEQSKELGLRKREIVQILAKNPTRRTHDELVDIAHLIKSIQFFVDREMNLESCISVAENLHYEYIEKGG